jgi:Animal haem peroxidase
MSGFGHGQVGTRERDFTSLLPLRAVGYDTQQLLALSILMQDALDEVKDGADGEENLLLPSGYTYFGQFIDHDLTFDNTSSLNPADIGEQDRLPTNLRTPRFDLDSLYGDGPDAQPFMYGDDGASLLYKKSGTGNEVIPITSNQQMIDGFNNRADEDLLRSPNGRAIIGDKRNDENSIISQIHLSFIKFHNEVVAEIQARTGLSGTALFEAARNEVRWAYQKLVIEDFLPRIVKCEVLADLQKAQNPANRSTCYALYTEDKRINLPREFVAAAYRFGHSGVRFGYRLNSDNDLKSNQPGRFSIFPSSDNPRGSSLLGFDPLTKTDRIDDWGRFFPTTTATATTLGNPPNEDADKNEIPNPVVRLQFAYKIDTTMVDPLTVLPPSVLPTSPNPNGALGEVEEAIHKKVPDPEGRPSLALLNLLRGNSYRIASGQDIVKVLQTKGFKQEDGFPIAPLDCNYLVVRKKLEDKSGFFTFTSIDPKLQADTPLWFYILAEAQANIIDKVCQEDDETFNEKQLTNPEIARTQLGWVGGRIVAEVFYGLIDSDPESYVNAAPKNWQPIWENNFGKDIIVANLLKFANQTITSVPESKTC